MDFGGLAVWVSGGDSFAEGLEAPHLRLDPASDVVSRPSLPECPAVVPGGAEGFVSGDCGRAVIFPRPPVLADRDDWSGLPVDDGRVATAGVIGPISGHGADLFVVGYLVEQLRQNGTVAIAAGGKFHRPDVRRGSVHGQMDLAPRALSAIGPRTMASASALNAMLSGLPFAIAEELDPGAVHQQVQGAIGAAVGDLDGQCLLTPAQGGVVGHRPVQVRHFEKAGHHPGRLPKRQLEQDLDRQAELDRCIRKHRRATGLAVMRRESGHLLVQPDQQRPPLA